ALLCKETDSPACLTAAQVATARAIYAGPANYAPGLEMGSELGWATMGGPQPLGLGLDLFKYVVFQDPTWDFRTFDFDKGVAAMVAAMREAERGILNATNPDLKAFFGRGGKLIQYHGWSDPQIQPGSSVNYFKRVMDSVGSAKASASYRLFMAPGMGHCGGGT